ncbi:PREDICTED: lachesin-like isoform X1 [Vollenhovia emeryi]|uniref:lachesin-like isoform X1 n=1 Tax=Vollenhovia emeryi TaxID=411798 RepID=UPI0005F3E679|nr:PREDICTED: lachesin-like isoform X1 [Vollenhovia emeryi]XP_011863766.1 PREDICTED: lachesin-like isoform X1 [Vollenhovia emeryi]
MRLWTHLDTIYKGLCKPTKSIEEQDYEDDTPVDEEDEDDEDEETDNTGTAEAPPQILSQPMSIQVEAGSTVKLPCQVIHTENYVVAWLKDDKYLYVETQPHTENKRIVRLPNNTLVIYNASVEDTSDEYKCSILRKPDTIDLNYRLRVYERPYQESATPPPQHSHKGIIRVIPSKKVDVALGHDLRLACETDIQPPPEIKWFIENKKVDGYDPDVSLDGNSIRINHVNETHSGLYQCLAEDGSKTPAMEAITVFVHYKPRIKVEKNVAYSGTGMESELACIVSAYPAARVSWYKGDKQIPNKKGTMHTEIPMKGNKTKHILKIFHTSTRDFGDYRCKAENNLGYDIKSVLLTGVPSPASVYGAEMIDDGIILKWRLESYSPINEYKLQYRRKGDPKWNFVDLEVKDGKGSQFVIESPIRELQRGSYEAILTARNAIGWSLDSSPHTFSSDYPPDLALKEGNSATIRSSGILLTLILVLLSCAFTSL